MASFRETTPEQYGSPATEDEDMRGGAEGKKKRFKPLSAVRKLFGGRSKRKKEETVVAVKAQSTTALHTSSRYGDDEDEDDDDGGFKTHQQKTAGLTANTRSLSEDSVFSPDQRPEPTIGSFPKSAVSEESLPKSAFQSELFSKLNKRRSQYSDDDRDDGLPKSPVPPITTADVIMGTPLKPPGQKSSNRDSDQSLISVDTSENEEDRLFVPNWKSAVPSVRGRDSNRNTGTMDPLDFSSIQKTELLKSGAAKDRISIKPKARRATRQSRRKSDNNSPLSLPSLNEETPPSPVETSSATKYSKTIETTSTTGAIKNRSPTALTSPKFPTANTSPTQVSPKTETPFQTPSSPKHKPASPISSKPSFGISSNRIGAADSSVTSMSSSSAATHPASKVSGYSPIDTGRENISVFSGHVSSADKDIPVESSSTAAKSTSSSPTKQSPNPSGEETSGGISLKSRLSQFQANSGSDKPSGTHVSSGLKSSDPGAKFSPKGEDYKQKRQGRSKTLPGTKDESGSNPSSNQSSPTVQRANSHRVAGRDSPEKKHSFISSSSKSSVTPSLVSSSTTSASSTTPSNINKHGSRFSAFESKGTAEPAWKSMARKKQEDGDDSISSGSSPRSVFTSASYLSGKRGSVDSSTSSGGNSSKNATPRDSNLEKVAEIADHTKKRESIEINVSELNTVKALPSKSNASSFPSSSATESTSVTSSSTTSDRDRVFSGTANASSNQTTPSSTTPTINSDSGSATSTATQSSNISDRFGGAAGIGRVRGGSVKTSPTKAEPSRPWLGGRGGSVKVSPAFLATSGSQPNSTAVSKPVLPSSMRGEDKSRQTSTVMQSQNNNNTSTSLPATHTVSVNSNNPTQPPASTQNPISPSLQNIKNNSQTTNTPQSSVLTSKPPLASDKSSSVKSVSFSSNVKPVSEPKSTPSSSPRSNASYISVVSSSSSSISSSQSNVSKPSSTSIPGRTHPVRAHASFTHPSSVKPVISPSSSPSINKSPSMRVQSSSKPPSSMPSSTSTSSNKFTTTPAAKRFDNQSKADKPTPTVPAWRASLVGKKDNQAGKKDTDIEIEIIETSPRLQSPQSNQTKGDVILRQGPNRSAFSDAAKKTEPSPVSASEKLNNRSSRVLDMVKNFQNLQVST